MTDSWSSRWYAPLVALGVAALVLVIVALAIVEVLVAAAPPLPGPSGWNAPLERAGDALRDGDVAQALAWWQEARREALRSGTWEGMIEVGDASRRLAAGDSFRREGDARARQAYMTALLRARREHSVDGVLRAAVAFGELGDRDVVAHALRIAEHQAAQDPRAREQVRAVANRWMSPSLEAGHPMSPGGVQP
jgi:hypothetical protein